jgi:hypothetical protein
MKIIKCKTAYIAANRLKSKLLNQKSKIKNLKSRIHKCFDFLNLNRDIAH